MSSLNPHQKNKVDISSLSPEEQRLFRLYGKLPNKKDLLQNKLKERKYFDSGDYAMSKAGKADDVGVTQIGSQHPVPENIPHLSSPSNGNGNGNAANGNNGQPQPGHQSGSPVKESSFLYRQTSVDDADEGEGQQGQTRTQGTESSSVSPPPAKEGLPIRS